MGNLTTVSEIRAELGRLMDVAGDMAIDATLNKNDRRVGLIVLRLFAGLREMIAEPPETTATPTKGVNKDSGVRHGGGA